MTVFFISVANYLYHLADDLEGTPIFTLDGPPDDGAAMGEGRGGDRCEEEEEEEEDTSNVLGIENDGRSRRSVSPHDGKYKNIIFKIYLT